MITKEQARVIFDLVQDIEDDTCSLAHESYEGSMSMMDQAQKDLDSSKAKLESFIESLTE